jgi:uncharacterized protein YjdB
LAPTFTSATPAVCTITSGGTLSFITTGTCSINADQTGGGSYSAAPQVVQSFVVNQTSQVITFAATSIKTYGDADFGPGASATTALAITYSSDNPAVATITAGGLIHIVGAGSATITATQAGDNTYLPTTAQQTLSVDKALLTVTADNKSRSFAAAEPLFTATYSGFVNGDDQSTLNGAPAFTTTATIATPTGNYPITPAIGTLAAANYSFTFADGTLAVGIASQSITFNPLAAKTYGAATFDLNATGGASGAPVIFTSSNPAVATITGSTVTITGAGTTTITATQAATGNYASATAQQELTVNKAALAVTAQDATRSYNTANPLFTAVITGFVNNENSAVVTGSPLFETAATVTTPVGSYPITVTTGTLAAANYSFTFVNGTLAIGLAGQSINFTPLSVKTYGDKAFDLTAVGGASGNPVSFSSSNPAVATVNGSVVTIIGAGQAVITASQDGTSNYASATAQQGLTVNKANLSVTADNASRVYATSNPLFTASFSGFVNNETSAVLSGSAAVASSADTNTPVGSYPITVAVGNLFSTNYSFTYVNGTLVITTATPQLVWSDPAAIIYGKPLGSGQLNATANVAGSFTYTPAAGTVLDAGVQPLTVVFTPEDTVNYSSQTAKVYVSVNKAAATVALGNLNHIYDGTAKSATAISTPSGLAVSLTYNGSSTAPVAVGSYAVVATVNAANYGGTASGTMTIAMGSQTITFAALPVVKLGTADFAPGATVSSGLALTYSSSNTAVATIVNGKIHPVGVGSSVITASQAGNASYPAVSASQTLTVIYNTTPPVLYVSALSNGATTTWTTQNISGIAFDINGIKSVTVNGTTVQLYPGGGFSYPVQLLTGPNVITVIATNKAGITTTNSRTIILDSTAPHLTVTYPPDNAVAFKKTITVTGTITDLFSISAVAKTAVPTVTVSYTINGSAAQSAALTDATYSFTTDLAEGMNTIQILATNAEGKTVESKRTVNYQLPTFSLAITDPAADIRTISDSYLLVGKVADNSTPVTVTVAMDGESFTPPVIDGVFKQQLHFTENKVYQVSVTGTDQNNSSLTVQRNIIRSLPTVDGGGSDPFTIVDALVALQMSAGIGKPDTGQMLRMDVAPMVNGVSVGDGKVDIEDVLVILYLAVGLIQ